MLKKLKNKIKLPQNSKIRAIVLLSGVVIIVAVAYVVLYNGKSSDADLGGSTIAPANTDEIDSTPGQKNLSNEYMHALLQNNKIQSTNALKQGKSYLPTMINTGDATSQSNSFSASQGDANAQDASESLIDALVKQGKISPDTAADLQRLANQGASVQDYANELQKLVSEGKLTPEQARELLAAYKKSHAKQLADSANGADDSAAVDPTLSRMAASGAIDPETAKMLENLSKANVPVSQYAEELNRLVREGKLTPEQARELLAAYQAKHGTPQEKSEAAQASGLDQMAAAQQLAAEQAKEQANAQMAAAERQQEQMQAQQAMQATQSSMAEQANRLFSSWNAPTPIHTVVINTTTGAAGKGEAGLQAGGTNAGSSASSAITAPLIKAGTIMFAVLDTALNSDEPGPVMATIVSGKYKGAKLIGSLTRQNDRVMLQFNLMSVAKWTGTAPINAVAINPDTARTALASSVNHHYLSRYGSLFASAFLASYAEALDDNGTTTITPLGTVQRTVSYSPEGRIMKGFGGVAQSLGAAAAQNFNQPPTVKVDSGVGLGILFQQDVKKPNFLTTNK